jgi:hypothetical protein
LTPSPARSSRRAGIVGPLAALFAVTLLCGTTPEEEQLFAQRRTRIAGMTHADVEQLKRNYEEFVKLSPERRRALQELDEEVQQDTANGGHLLKLLTSYNRWLSSLSPFDQERILSKTDPSERGQVVKAIYDEQQKRLAVASLNAGARLGTALDRSDFDTVLKAVEEHFLTAESRAKIPEQLSGRERHLRILKAAQQQAHTAAASQTLIQTLLEAIPNETVKSRIEKGAARTPRRMLGQVLSRSLATEWWDEARTVLPKPAAVDEEINRRLAAISAPKRDQQKQQLSSRQGRRMVGFELAIDNDHELKEQLQPVYLWLKSGLQPRPGAGRNQPATPPDETHPDEAENKAKSAE